eukprot:2880904-Amphidinium_carterae.1
MVDYLIAASHEVTPWQDHEDPGTYLTRAMDKMAETVIATAPARGPQKKPWILKRSWAHMHMLNRWRRVLTALRRRDDVTVQRLTPQLGHSLMIMCRCALDPELCLCSSRAALLQRTADRVRHLTIENKKNLKRDRRQWFARHSEDAAEHEKEHRSRELHQTVRAMSRIPTARGSRLQDEDGYIVSDRSRVSGMWLKYWRTHFGAKPGTPASFNDRVALTTAAATLDHEGGPDLSFTEDEVLSTLKKMQKWKATADKAPAAAVIALADCLAKPLCKLFNDSELSSCHLGGWAH